MCIICDDPSNFYRNQRRAMLGVKSNFRLAISNDLFQRESIKYLFSEESSRCLKIYFRRKKHFAIKQLTNLPLWRRRWLYNTFTIDYMHNTFKPMKLSWKPQFKLFMLPFLPVCKMFAETGKTNPLATDSFFQNFFYNSLNSCRTPIQLL